MATHYNSRDKPLQVLEEGRNLVRLESYYYVDTEHFSYRASTIDAALNLWRKNSADLSKVRDVGRVG